MVDCKNARFFLEQPARHVGVLGSVLRKLVEPNFDNGSRSPAAARTAAAATGGSASCGAAAAAIIHHQSYRQLQPPPHAQQPPAGHSIKRRRGGSPVWAKFRLLGAADAPHSNECTNLRR
jgi:hypothetical protein